MNVIKLLLGLPFILIGCTIAEIPKEKHYQFNPTYRTDFKNDTLLLYLSNPVKCPVRFYVTSSDSILDQKLTRFKPITLEQKSDTVLKFAMDSTAIETLHYPNYFGDVNQPILNSKMSLPFSKGRTYKIVQGYDGRYSHDIDDYSRYAIDFGLTSGDTVCAADDGFVVGLIEEYTDGDDDEKFRPYANLVTLYHPNSGLFTQYLHLLFKSSLVELGDSVKRGQPIALSGETGYTSGEHLHFVVLAPVRDGLTSVKVSFIEGYEGKSLTRGDRVVK